MKHLRWYQKFWFYVAAIISCGLSVYIFNLGKIAEDKIILEENTKNEEKKQAAKLLTALQQMQNLQLPRLLRRQLTQKSAMRLPTLLQ